MDEKLVDKLVSMKRPEIVQIQGTGTFIYCDYDKRYTQVKPNVFDRQVSNIESFAAYLIKFVDNYLSFKNDTGTEYTGRYTTVSFSQNKATAFLQDDAGCEDRINYHRTLSPQWQLLSDKTNKRLSHNELLRVLQGLRPSFPSSEAYNDFMRQYRKVSFDEKVTVNSQPQVEQGRGGSSIVVEFGRNGGTGQTALPNTLALRMQYARDSQRYYEIELEIDSSLNTDTKDKPKLEFSILWPEQDNVIAQAVSDEIADFKALVAEKLPELLVVVNY